jgi:hypothetical protein
MATTKTKPRSQGRRVKEVFVAGDIPAIGCCGAPSIMGFHLVIERIIACQRYAERQRRSFSLLPDKRASMD